MLGDTAVAVHPDPAGALDKAEAELRERLDKAPAKEKDGIQAQIDNIAAAPHRRCCRCSSRCATWPTPAAS